MFFSEFETHLPVLEIRVEWWTLLCIIIRVNCNKEGEVSSQLNEYRLPNKDYELIYQLDAIEYLFVHFQLEMFRAYTPIFRSNGCYNFFTYTAYGVLGVVRRRC